MKKVIYPGTFDPITNGHLDIIERATHLFDKVIVAIAASTKKTTVFSAAEREQLATQVLAKYKNVEVCGFSGLLIDLAKTKDTFIIIRGLRALSDFEYEFQLANMNRNLEPRMETVFLTPSEQFSYISASLVREIASLGGDVTHFVPKEVQTALKKLYS
jgi:pantetheine-phosphate adenylyltransferase